MNDMIYTYDLQIADLLIRVNSPIELKEQYELTPFVVSCAPESYPDAVYTISILPPDWQAKGTQVAQAPHSAIYEWQDEIHRYFHWNVFSNDRFILLKSTKSNPSEHTIYLQENTLQRMMPQFRLSAFLAPEQLLLKHQGFLLHASVIDWQGKGILFTGPSGIGKSTQAQLWSELENATIINGDRTIIRSNSVITAWGSPYAGTSKLYINQSVPICAIVVLSQGKENVLRRLTRISAFQQILQEATTQPWDQKFMNDLTDLILAITNRIPVYHLTCTPTVEAVEMLKKELYI